MRADFGFLKRLERNWGTEYFVTTIARVAAVRHAIVLRGEVVLEEEFLGVRPDLDQRSRGYLKSTNNRNRTILEIRLQSFP